MGLTYEEKFVIDAANKLKTAVELNKKAGFSIADILVSVKEHYKEYEVIEIIAPDNAGWINNEL